MRKCTAFQDAVGKLALSTEVPALHPNPIPPLALFMSQQTPALIPSSSHLQVEVQVRWQAHRTAAALEQSTLWLPTRSSPLITALPTTPTPLAIEEAGGMFCVCVYACLCVDVRVCAYIFVCTCVHVYVEDCVLML